MKKIISRKSNNVLQGYKKVGAKFIPPMLHRIGPLDYVSWSSLILPEIVWWDVLIDRVSNRFAAKVAEEIGKYFQPRENKDCWWAFASDYIRLDAEDWRRLKRHLEGAAVLSDIREALADFLDLYPQCPIRHFQDTQPSGLANVGYVQGFESRMKELASKRSRAGVLVQAQVVYMGFVLGKLRVKRGLALADFPEVEHYPSTERSKQVGASICATVNMLTGAMLPKYGDDDWVQYFWKRSLELRPLNFSHLEQQ